jgi:nucleoid DNA-binding protein
LQADFQREIPHFTIQEVMMTKADLVEKIAKDTEITKVQAETAFKSLLDGITGALKAGDKVTFVGFGSFSVSDRKARIGRNPQNGKEIKIPARKAVSFSVGKALKEAVQAPAKKVKKKK